MLTPYSFFYNILEGSSVKYDLIYVVYILDYLDIYDFKEKSNVIFLSINHIGFRLTFHFPLIHSIRQNETFE